MIEARHLTKRYGHTVAVDAATIGQTAATHTITLLELATRRASLEEAFFDLTRDETNYRAGQLAGSSKGI